MELGRLSQYSCTHIETLIPLVESVPNLVPKDALVQRVWPGTHVVESALLRNISELRRRFAPEFGERAVIETVPTVDTDLPFGGREPVLGEAEKVPQSPEKGPAPGGIRPFA